MPSSGKSWERKEAGTVSIVCRTVFATRMFKRLQSPHHPHEQDEA